MFKFGTDEKLGDSFNFDFSNSEQTDIDDFDSNAGGNDPQPLKINLKSAFVKSWSTSGDADDRPTEIETFGPDDFLM
ncbi:hypothetical protein [Roseibium sp. MMSF_3544]|uniref:hypothetical protein n=1 Tax=unclassified Roseibium TaxID=2629323 RepID=UPI00273FF921|nr:hypothetical protein [Roseibium sp. MMSF_3544]